mmetsp:Transcript_6605/g.16490  ORF Transcript_6605/g.16490 Transcript_6605/m.16490 type:complete len:106 (-) Transcript_6605:134-451(-)
MHAHRPTAQRASLQAAPERVPCDHFSSLGLTSSSRSLSQRFSIESAFSPCHSNASPRSNSPVLSPGCLQDEGMAREQGCDLGAEGKSSGVQECHRVMGADDEERN